MDSEAIAPVLIERACGEWLAISPPHYALKIGIRATGRSEAEEGFSAAFKHWQRLLSKQKPLRDDADV